MSDQRIIVCDRNALVEGSMLGLLVIDDYDIFLFTWNVLLETYTLRNPPRRLGKSVSSVHAMLQSEVDLWVSVAILMNAEC